MSCRIEEELTAYVDGALGAEDRARVEAHLATCETCRATHATLARAIGVTGALPRFEVSPGLRRSVLAAIEEADPFWKRWRWPAVVLGGATAAAALVFVVAEPTREAIALERAEGLELAANLEVVRDLDLVGVETPDDFDVVAQLDALEASP